jgi:hypothetical protein
MFYFARSLVFVAAAGIARAQPPAPAVAQYIKYPDTQTTVLAHVRVIDGTGAPALEDQTLTIAHGKIVAVEPATQAHVPSAALVLDLSGTRFSPVSLVCTTTCTTSPVRTSTLREPQNLL